MKITWTEYKTIRKIKKYLGENWEETPKKREDFYNFVTGEVICRCGKKMRPLRALFHYHLLK
jgi:hypothetical protein